jgi:hypothetical protein
MNRIDDGRIDEGPFAAEERGTVTVVTDEGCVSIEYPGGRQERVRVPLEQVPSYRSLVGRGWRRLPPLASRP